MRFRYVCSDCGRVYKTDDIMYLCPECSKDNDGKTFSKGNLIVELTDEVLKKAGKKEHVTAEDFYPYEVKHSKEFPIGITPLVEAKRLNSRSGLKNTLYKLDSQLISGSFKDRASYLVAEQALCHNEKKIALASTGNAGAAMSTVGGALGLDIILFVPENAPINKLMQSVLYGAHVVPVKGSYDDAFNLSIEYTKRFGGINRNTAYNPMTIEGKKSISIELFEQMGSLKKAGLIDTLPHIICAQSDKSDAITKAFESGEYLPVKATTRADSISVSLPANGRMAVRYIKESDGWCVRVSDEEIIDAELELAKEAGILSEPAAACAYAAYKKDAENIKKKLGEDASVVVLLTGTGFKDMAVFDGKVKLPKAIDATVEEVGKLDF